jgi:hypothetical protein
MTGAAPIGWTRADLELQRAGSWIATNIRGTRTAGFVVAYPGLGRQSVVAGPSRHYRVRLTAEFYRPLFLATVDGVEFDAPPFNDANPPVPITTLPTDVLLAPSTNYPFPAHIPVVRGVVLDSTAQPVSNVYVESLNLERVLTDETGSFALPMRFMPLNVPLAIDATDQRSTPNRVGQISVTLPADLGQSQTITIS